MKLLNAEQEVELNIATIGLPYLLYFLSLRHFALRRFTALLLENLWHPG